jgi:hypothetical protein
MGRSSNNHDLVGKQYAGLFIRDGIHLPDFMPAMKPESHNEIPQAQSAGKCRSGERVDDARNLVPGGLFTAGLVELQGNDG